LTAFGAHAAGFATARRCLRFLVFYLFIYRRTFFRELTTGQMRRQIFAHDGSNDADSRKDVPFWGFVDIPPYLGGNIPQNPILGANRRFQAKLVKSKNITYYQNYCVDSNQILHSDRDHQMPFVGGPNSHITNPRWRTAAIWKKSTNCHISAAVLPISTKFGRTTQFGPLEPSTVKAFKF